MKKFILPVALAGIFVYQQFLIAWQERLIDRQNAALKNAASEMSELNALVLRMDSNAVTVTGTMRLATARIAELNRQLAVCRATNGKVGL